MLLDVDSGWHGGWLTTYKTYVHKNKISVIPSLTQAPVLKEKGPF